MSLDMTRRNGQAAVHPDSSEVGTPSLSPADRARKRVFDVVASIVGLALVGWLIALAWVAAAIDTRQSGFFRQVRVGRHARPFLVIKLRTMRALPGVTTTVTAANDPRVTRLGRLLRRTKIDELPQLINVLRGDMSFVGPRPEVPGFADRLEGDDRIILSVRPGITGPATVHYRHEEQLLAAQPDPERYNREVLFPAKVRFNVEYVRTHSFRTDLTYIWRTLFR